MIRAEYKVNDKGIPYYSSVFKQDAFSILCHKPSIDYATFNRINNSKKNRTIPKKDFEVVLFELQTNRELQILVEQHLNPDIRRLLNEVKPVADPTPKEKPKPIHHPPTPVAQPEPNPNPQQAPQPLNEEQWVIELLKQDAALTHGIYALNGGVWSAAKFGHMKNQLRKRGMIPKIPSKRVSRADIDHGETPPKTKVRKRFLNPEWYVKEYTGVDRDHIGKTNERLKELESFLQEFIAAKIPGEFRFIRTENPPRLEIMKWEEHEVDAD